MEKKYIVHPLKFAISLTTFLASLILAGTMLKIHRPGSFVFFLIVGFLFAIVAMINGSVITINDQGIKRSSLFITTKCYLWNEISEIGVAGSRIFHQKDKEQTGTLYIYTSKIAMTEEERFAMMLKWPQMDKIYLQHTKDRMDSIQMIWSGKVQTYNTGNLRF